MTRSAPKLTRRSFAAFSCTAPALAAVGATVPDADEVEAFLAVSARLTGFAPSELDADFATGLLAALFAAGPRPQLTRLLGGASVPALEEDIISAWYTGTLPLPSGPVVAALRDALVWQAADFAIPRGICAGAGTWGEPPQGVERPAA